MPRYLATTLDLPAGPPPEVLQQIDVAWERARELFASDRALHFEVDALRGGVRAEQSWFGGSLVERLSAAEALALACGDAPADLALTA